MDEECIKEMIRQELMTLLASMQEMSVEVDQNDHAAYVVGTIIDYTRSDLRLRWHEESTPYKEEM